MKRVTVGTACAIALTIGSGTIGFGTIGFGSARAQDQGTQDTAERICAQGTYSLPCPEVIWCPAGNCGIGIPLSDGNIEIISSSEEEMQGTHRRPVQAGNPMSLQHLAGRVIVFEWDDSGEVENPGSDLVIKNILYVIMPPPNAG